LEPMRKFNRAMEEILGSDVDDFTQYLNLNEGFHLAVFDIAKNQTLRRAIDQIYRLPFVAPSGRVILRQTVPGWTERRPLRKSIIGPSSTPSRTGRERARRVSPVNMFGSHEGIWKVLWRTGTTWRPCLEPA